MHRIRAGPILEVDAAFGKDFLHRADKFIHKGIEFLSRWPCFTHAEIQRIVKILLVIRACVQVHRQQIAGWNAGAGGVELKLTDWDSGAIRAEVAQAKYPSAVGDANEADILFRPVFENLLHAAAALDGQIHPAGLTIDVSELEACLTDGRIVHDRKKPGGVRHDGPIKESFIVIEQVDQVNVALQIRVLLAELEHHTL